jgi:hypothetical protein
VSFNLHTPDENHNPKVGGSNPSPATIYIADFKKLFEATHLAQI